MILCANPRLQYLTHKREIDRAVTRVMDRGRYILGEEVKAFESEFAAYIGAKYGIGVGSGTDALHLALAACNIGPGDEVITVSHTAVATVAAIEQAGANPVFVDIESDFFTMDPRKIEKMARKNREQSQKRYEEETKKPSIGATEKRRKELEEVAPDPRYEGADRLFNEMKKKDRH